MADKRQQDSPSPNTTSRRRVLAAAALAPALTPVLGAAPARGGAQYPRHVQNAPHQRVMKKNNDRAARVAA
ncbi:hypothetical protein ACWES4_34160, partial [Streptomyces sp. NPDC004011]